MVLGAAMLCLLRGRAAVRLLVLIIRVEGAIERRLSRRHLLGRREVRVQSPRKPNLFSPRAIEPIFSPWPEDESLRRKS
jgi:hypothetical protein